MLWLVEDDRTAAQAAASRSVQSRLDLHLRRCRLQSGANTKLGRRSFDGVSLGRSASSRARGYNESSRTREINPLNIANHEKQDEKSRAHQFDSSLLGFRP